LQRQFNQHILYDVVDDDDDDDDDSNQMSSDGFLLFSICHDM